MMTDPIADMLTRIRNINMIGGTKVDVPASRMKANICKVLKEEGYIKSFKIIAKAKNDIRIRVTLKEGTIKGLQRVSKPGLRTYAGFNDIPRVISGLGISILTTNKGIMSSRTAKKLNIGGEIICKIW